MTYKLYKSRNPETGEERNNVVEAFQYTGSEETYQNIIDEYYPIKNFIKKENGDIYVPELDNDEGKHIIKVGDYLMIYNFKNKDGVMCFGSTVIPEKSFNESFVVLSGIEEVTLTEDNMEYVSKLGDLFDVDLGMPVTKESKPDFFEQYGPCLLSLCFTPDAGAILKADGSYTFIFNYDDGKCQMKVNKKDEQHDGTETEHAG